jgi:hypothetical protein
MVECAFGVVCNKWRMLHLAIDVYPDFCDVIIKTCCILHIFFRERDGFQFQGYMIHPVESNKVIGTRGNITGTAVREYFATYFTSQLGSFPWHYEKV